MNTEMELDWVDSIKEQELICSVAKCKYPSVTRYSINGDYVDLCEGHDWKDNAFDTYENIRFGSR